MLAGRHTALDRWLIVASGVFFAGDLSFWYWGVTLSSVADATFLANTTPIFVALVSWLMFGERLERSFLLPERSFPSPAPASHGAQQCLRVSAHGALTGDALALVMPRPCLYTGYVLSMSRVRRRVSTTVTMAGELCIYGHRTDRGRGADRAAVLWPATAHGWLADRRRAGVHRPAYAGQTAIALSLAHVPANLAALTSPCDDAAAGPGRRLRLWVMFDERMTLIQGLGAALILAGRGPRTPVGGRRKKPDRNHRIPMRAGLDTQRNKNQNISGKLFLDNVAQTPRRVHGVCRPCLKFLLLIADAGRKSSPHSVPRAAIRTSSPRFMKPAPMSSASTSVSWQP